MFSSERGAGRFDQLDRVSVPGPDSLLAVEAGDIVCHAAPRAADVHGPIEVERVIAGVIPDTDAIEVTVAVKAGLAHDGVIRLLFSHPEWVRLITV